MQLEIGKEYILSTTSGYIDNKKIRVLSYCSYEKAAKYNNFIEHIAINEKFINIHENTDDYLKSILYYECVEIDENNKAFGNIIIVWDDIIDSTKTRLYNYGYNYDLVLTLVNSNDYNTINIDDVITFIKNEVNIKYNMEQKNIAIDITSTTKNTSSENDTMINKLERSEEVIEQSTYALESFNALKTSAQKIANNFETNNINSRVNDLVDKISTIESNISTILSRLQ